MKTSEAFKDWHDSYYDPWWKNHRAPLWAAWSRLAERKVPEEEIAEVFSTVADAVRDQYGD